jgi:hypothetical protein
VILSVRLELKRRRILASLYTPPLHKLIVKEATELREWSKIMTTGRQEQLAPPLSMELKHLALTSLTYRRKFSHRTTSMIPVVLSAVIRQRPKRYQKIKAPRSLRRLIQFLFRVNECRGESTSIFAGSTTEIGSTVNDAMDLSHFMSHLFQVLRSRCLISYLLSTLSCGW